jgi:hypothetical protein
MNSFSGKLPIGVITLSAGDGKSKAVLGFQTITAGAIEPSSMHRAQGKVVERTFTLGSDIENKHRSAMVFSQLRIMLRLASYEACIGKRMQPGYFANKLRVGIIIKNNITSKVIKKTR